MVMVQDGPYANAPEKPLRIMGDQQRCQRGKDLVQDLLTEKELEVKIFVSASDVLFVYLIIFFHLSKTRECSWKFNTLQTFR